MKDDGGRAEDWDFSFPHPQFLALTLANYCDLSTQVEQRSRTAILLLDITELLYGSEKGRNPRYPVQKKISLRLSLLYQNQLP